jgi:hypothetical protein
MLRIKRLGLTLAAVFAMSAVVASALPAMASASTKEYGVGSPFKAFTVPTNVVSEKAPGSGDFILENKEKEGIDCSSFSDKGVFENKENAKKELIGKSIDNLTFDGCTPIKGLGVGCTEINPKTNHEITGEVSDEVISETKVEITVLKGFNVKCVVAGSEVNLGEVTGTAKGTVKGNELSFKEAAGLKFSGEASTITGTDATKTEVTKEAVLVG